MALQPSNTRAHRGDFVIEADVPLPADARRGGGLKGALKELSQSQIGASMLITQVKYGSIQAAVGHAAGRGWATVRTVEEGFRVWKIAEPKMADAAKAKVA